jgi:RNA polymerase sigma-70 factor (ECF subfamily)
LQNKEDAEEVFQDVFMSVHQKIDSFEGKAHIKTWLYRIAVNRSLDFIKAKKTKKRFAFFKMSNIDDLEINSKINHPGVLLENKEATERIFKAINKLPKNQKSALILKSIEQLSQKEISQILGIGEKAVESLLSRARRNLKEILNTAKD